METIARVEDNRVVLRIERDPDPESPRDWDNLGTMVCWHRRYRLGDHHDFPDPETFSRRITARNAILLPLFLYDHGILRLSTQSWHGRAPHAEWDSGQVGWIYVLKEDVRREWGVKHISPKLRRHIENVLRAEVGTYDQYLAGDVYGFILERKVSCGCCDTCACEPSLEHEDSCWGFYGTDWATNGLAEMVGNEYADLVGRL